MTDDRVTKKPGAAPDHPLQEVDGDVGEGGEADIKPELGIDDGRPDRRDESPRRDLSGS